MCMCVNTLVAFKGCIARGGGCHCDRAEEHVEQCADMCVQSGAVLRTAVGLLQRGPRRAAVPQCCCPAPTHTNDARVPSFRHVMHESDESDLHTCSCRDAHVMASSPPALHTCTHMLAGLVATSLTPACSGSRSSWVMLRGSGTCVRGGSWLQRCCCQILSSWQTCWPSTSESRQRGLRGWGGLQGGTVVFSVGRGAAVIPELMADVLAFYK